MDTKDKYKSTADRFLEEIRRACHAMIDQNYISESPVKLVKEAIEYLEEKYEEDKDKQKNNEIP